MTTYVSFAGDVDKASSTTSQDGGDKSTVSSVGYYSQISSAAPDSLAMKHLNAACDDDGSLQTSVQSDIQEYSFPSYYEIDIWNGIADESTSKDLELSTHSSGQLEGFEACGEDVSTARALSSSPVSEVVCVDLDLVNLDQASTGSSDSLTPSIGVNSIRTLETSLRGLLLLEDETNLRSAQPLLALPPPPSPPPPHLIGLPTILTPDLPAKPRLRTCSSTTSESTNDACKSSISGSEVVAGEDKATMTEHGEDIERKIIVDEMESMTDAREVPDCTIKAMFEDKATMTDGFTMADDDTNEVSEEGRATDGLGVCCCIGDLCTPCAIRQKDRSVHSSI